MFARGLLIISISFNFGVFSFESCQILTNILPLGRCFLVSFRSWRNFGSNRCRCKNNLSCKSYFIPAFSTFGIVHMPTDIWITGLWFLISFCTLQSFGSKRCRRGNYWIYKSDYILTFSGFGICHMPSRNQPLARCFFISSRGLPSFRSIMNSCDDL